MGNAIGININRICKQAEAGISNVENRPKEEDEEEDEEEKDMDGNVVDRKTRRRRRRDSIKKKIRHMHAKGNAHTKVKDGGENLENGI